MNGSNSGRFGQSVALVLGALAAVSSVSEAGYVASTGAYSGPSIVEARARNGLTGFEGVLFTPSTPSSGAQLNPVGTPAWAYGQYAGFAFTFDSMTGTSTWSIDFNRDGDFLDSEESVTSVASTLANTGFDVVNLFLQGSDAPLAGAMVMDFTLNGTNFGNFSSANGTATQQLFAFAGGSADVTATGSVMFTASGGSQERPRLWIQMGSSFVVPAPASLALLGLAGLAGARRRR